MDPLLFLCNLHAEGPATWRRLRARGIARPADVAALPVERLAEWLGDSPAAARRFVREAERLAHGANVLGEVESAERVLEVDVRMEPLVPRAPAGPTSSVGTTPRASEPAQRESVRPASIAPAPSTVPHSPVESSPVAPGTWTPAPAASPRTERVRALPLDEIAPWAALPSTKVDSPLARPVLAHGSPRSPRLAARDETLLAPGRLAGLDLAACQRLVAAGVRTFEDLARIPAPRLAAATGLPAERLRAWQEGADADAVAELEPVRVLQPAPRGALPRTVWHAEPPLAPARPSPTSRRSRVLDLEDVAGPFA